jgi:hypothetical protein
VNQQHGFKIEETPWLDDYEESKPFHWPAALETFVRTPAPVRVPSGQLQQLRRVRLLPRL